MKYYLCNSLYPFPWEQVAQAHWCRYPNPESSHVLSEDTTYREVINNRLHSRRLLTKTNRMPKWGECLVSSRQVSIIEESIVDPVKKEITTYTRNVGLTKLMSCIEKVTYRPNPDNPKSTIAVRQAWIDSSIFGLGYAIQRFGIERYRSNVNRTNRGLIWVLNKMFPEPASLSIPTPDHSLTFEERRQKLKDAACKTAQRAKELAQEKTRPIIAACEGVKN